MRCARKRQLPESQRRWSRRSRARCQFPNSRQATEAMTPPPALQISAAVRTSRHRPEWRGAGGQCDFMGIARSRNAGDRLEVAATDVQPRRDTFGRDLHVLCFTENAIQIKGLQASQPRRRKRMVEIQDLQVLDWRKRPKSRPRKMPRAGKPSWARLCAESNLNHSFVRA